MTGHLKTPSNFDGFDYQQYLARRNIFSVMYQPDIVVLETGGANPIFGFILAIKARAQDAINHLFPEPQAALLSGILLGYDRGLPNELAEDFRATGMTPIITISGEIAITLLAQNNGSKSRNHGLNQSYKISILLHIYG